MGKKGGLSTTDESGDERAAREGIPIDEDKFKTRSSQFFFFPLFLEIPLEYVFLVLRIKVGLRFRACWFRLTVRCWVVLFVLNFYGVTMSFFFYESGTQLGTSILCRGFLFTVVVRVGVVVVLCKSLLKIPIVTQLLLSQLLCMCHSEG